MSDSYSVTSSESWFSRIKSSIGGIFIAIILIIVALLVLFFNEGRAVTTSKSLKEGAAAVVHVPTSPIDPANAGKLIHFTGMTNTTAKLKDATFGVEVQALTLVRTVEMYQWKETSKSTTKEKVGGSKETVTTYDYNKEWAGSAISSSDFKNQAAGHENPGMFPYQAQTLAAKDVTVGDFKIPERAISDLGGGKPLTLDDTALTAAPSATPRTTAIVVPIATATPSPVEGTIATATASPAAASVDPTKPKLNEGAFYYGENPGSPQVGDVRVRFASLAPTEISVLAAQEGDTIAPYQTKAGRALETVQVGSASAAEMFASAQKGNTILTWALRFGGWLLMFIGLTMIFKPLVMIGKFVPFIGSMIAAGTGLISFAIASVVSLVVVAIAWIVYRPLLGIVLLVIAAALAVFALMKIRAAKASLPAVNKAVPAQ